MLKDKILDKTEDIVYLTLSLIAVLFILFETVHLGYVFYTQVVGFSFAEDTSLALTGVPIFFNILIALELLETFKGHHKSILSRVKIIFLVALTAVIRKIIVLDIKHTDYLIVFSFSVIIISLCLGYYFLSRKMAAKGKE